MKNTLFILSLMFSFTLFAQVEGKLEVTQGFSIKGDKNSLYVRPGISEISVEYEPEFWGSGNIIFSHNDKKYEFDIQNESSGKKLKEEAEFTLSSKELGQSFSMKGKRISKVIKTYQEEKEEDCTYCGYCFGLTYEGKMDYGLNPACDGTETVLYQVNDEGGIYEITFLSQDKKVLGTFKSAPKKFKSYKKIKVISSCS